MFIQKEVVQQTIKCVECDKDIEADTNAILILDNTFNDKNGLFCLMCALDIIEDMRYYLTVKVNEINRLIV